MALAGWLRVSVTSAKSSSSNADLSEYQLTTPIALLYIWRSQLAIMFTNDSLLATLHAQTPQNSIQSKVLI